MATISGTMARAMSRKVQRFQRHGQFVEAIVEGDDQLEAEQRLDARHDGARLFQRVLGLLIERFALDLASRF
jgi:hypothetical protein